MASLEARPDTTTMGGRIFSAFESAPRGVLQPQRIAVCLDSMKTHPFFRQKPKPTKRNQLNDRKI
jgi:hypothetical protein